MCWSRWNIHLPSSTYLSIDFSTHPTTYLPTYLSTHRSIYISLSSRGIGCSRPCPWPPGRPWSRGTASCPSYSTGPQRPSPGRQGLPSRTSVCAGPFVRQRRMPFCPAGASPGCPTRDTQGGPLAATPFAGGLPQWGWPLAQWTPTARCAPELDRWRTVARRTSISWFFL